MRWIAESHFFVAEAQGRLLGCAAMNGAGKITLNYVAPAARFQGEEAQAGWFGRAGIR